MPVPGPGLNGADLVNHIHTFQNLAENTVPEMVLMLPLMIQKRIVYGVNKKLAGSRIDHRRAGHRQGAALVQQPVGRFVFDGKLRLFHLHVFIHSAALNHEVLDNAVKYKSVIMAILYIGEKVSDGNRGFLLEKLDFDAAHGRFQHNLRVLI